MRSIVITGANRGIGLGLIKNFLQMQNPPQHIIATCRNVEQAKELNEMRQNNPNLHIVEFDVGKFETYEKFCSKIADIVQSDQGLNVLVNNAGISPKSTRIHLVSPDQMLDTYRINTVAPVMLSKYLLPLLKKAAHQNSSTPISIHKAAVINVTSILGSITDNTTGGANPYRCSKAALNIATKSLSAELEKDGILVTCIHPGWIRTGMGGPKAPLEVEEITPKIVNLLNNLKKEHNGKFLDCTTGREIPW